MNLNYIHYMTNLRLRRFTDLRFGAKPESRIRLLAPLWFECESCLRIYYFSQLSEPRIPNPNLRKSCNRIPNPESKIEKCIKVRILRFVGES